MMFTGVKEDNKEIDMNFEYSPSRNAVLRLSVDVDAMIVEEKFLKICKEETDLCLAKYNVKENVRYGTIGRQVLDIYFKGKEEGTPIFVFIHGGYWRSLDKSTSGVGAPLVESGYRFIAVDYNLCPEYTLEEITKQLNDFSKWLLDYAQQTKAASISLCGHSAGAHLVAAMLFDSDFYKTPSADLVKSIFLISGIYDLREMYEVENANPGNILSLDEQKAKQLSPLCWEFSKELIDFVNHVFHTEFFLMVTQYDSGTFQKQTHDYNKSLKTAGFNSTFKLFKNYDHFDIIEDLRLESSDISKFILEKLENHH